MFRTTEADDAAGFALIEVLVALMIIVISLSAISTLIATSVRGTRSMEERWARFEVARAIAADLPDRDQLTIGHLAGEVFNHRWRVDVAPFAPTDAKAAGLTAWTPQLVVITVRSPSGTPVEIPTVRLRRSGR